MNHTNHILLFARYPVPGQAKTRLIPAIGPDGAALLHRRMAENAVAVARAVKADGDTEVTLCFTGAPLRSFRAWLGTDLQFQQQSHGDLGERMRRAFASAFSSGSKRVVAVGTDVPRVSPELLRRAMVALDSSDIVFGPADDGGYYLLGMRRLYTDLFSDMDWGTGSVCSDTVSAAERLGLEVTELPTLSDIDRPEELDSLRDDGRFADVFTRQPLLSVVVPTLNEAAALPETLESIRTAEGIEIIVVDGGSRDGTCEVAEQAGAAVLKVSGGRAAQQNAGAKASGGRYLLFLHADTHLPDGYADMVRKALDAPETVAGAFRFRTDDSRPVVRLVEWGANIRSSFFQLPYGDQGLFMEKRVFDETGGFSALPIMEDFDLVRRLRKRGRIIALPARVITSARRWRELGVFRTTLRNQVMIAGFLAGVSPERLASLYCGGSDTQSRCTRSSTTEKETT